MRQSGDDGGLAGLCPPSHLLFSPLRHLAFSQLVLCVFFIGFASFSPIACCAQMVADLSSKLSGLATLGVFLVEIEPRQFWAYEFAQVNQHLHSYQIVSVASEHCIYYISCPRTRAGSPSPNLIFSGLNVATKTIANSAQ